MDDLDFGATIKGFNPGQRIFNRYTLKKSSGAAAWVSSGWRAWHREYSAQTVPHVMA
jgi:hypothetical protein